MFSSTDLKKIITEIRPIIERQLDDAQLIAGFRNTVAEQGGDWSALKALVKAQIKDERDEAGDGKHVRAILERAEYSSVYADMLGWANMNENNFSADNSLPEATVKGEADGTLPRTASPAVEISTQHPNPATSSPPETGGDVILPPSLASSPTNSDDFDPLRDMPAHLRDRTWEKKEA